MSSGYAAGLAVLLATIAVTLLSVAYRARRVRLVVVGTQGDPGLVEDGHDAYWAAVAGTSGLTGQELVVDEVTFAALRRSYQTGVYQGLGGQRN